MKPRFLLVAALMLIGAGLVGYQYGRSTGEAKIRIETKKFLSDFARSTGLETYFRERGEPQRAVELIAYEPGATPGVHFVGGPFLSGVACIAVGIFGLQILLRSRANADSD